MNSKYKIVMYDKHKKIINSTDYFGTMKYAKIIFDILMYQTGVRYGQLLEDVKGVFNKVHDDIIIHEGE